MYLQTSITGEVGYRNVLVHFLITNVTLECLYVVVLGMVRFPQIATLISSKHATQTCEIYTSYAKGFFLKISHN